MENIPKIFCIGANLESFRSLEFLVDQGCHIDSLITLPSGLDEHVSDYYDLHDFCKSHQINVIDTTNVNSEDTIEKVAQLKPDYLFTLGWSQIFREAFINCFSKFIVGTHPSMLPYGRGRAPLPWTIIEDLRHSAVSFFKIDTGVDTGKIIFQREFDIPERIYVNELYDKVANELASGFYELYRWILAGKEISLKEQSNKGVSVRAKRSPEDGIIDFHRSIQEVEKLIRAVSEPYPGAYCYYKDQKIIFWEVDFDLEQTHSGNLGQILKKKDDSLLVQFADGNLWLKKPTNEEGKTFDMKFFRLGDKLGYNVQDEIFNLRKRLSK